MLETGRDALLVGELAQASAAGLLGVLTEDYDPDAARTELAGWITARGGREGALRQLTDAVRTMTFRTRAQAMLDVLAALFVGALQERGFRGDEELADRLGAATGYAAISLLRPLAVDLEMLAMLLEGDPAESGGRIDLSTGECQPAFTDELGPGPEAGEDDDPERWLYVPALGSRAGYRDMQLFIEDVGDAALADRLRIAIGERGAFRRFKDVLAGHERSWSRYHRFRDERQRGRTRAWLAEEGYYPHVTFLVEPSSGSCTSGPV